QPYTMFTLADNGNKSNYDATLMNTIATSVLKHGNDATIAKINIQRLTATAKGEIKAALTRI
ncbi:hypothetical protein BC940DRAFT_224232, partial [Gongronella butleri]